MKVLFIGNSHTFVHYVPARIQRNSVKVTASHKPALCSHIPVWAWVGTCGSPRLTSTFCGAAMTP